MYLVIQTSTDSKRIAELINEHNVQLIDLSSIKGENKKLFCDYAHKTLEGNKLVAKTIYEFLEENSKEYTGARFAKGQCILTDPFLLHQTGSTAQ